LTKLIVLHSLEPRDSYRPYTPQLQMDFLRIKNSYQLLNTIVLIKVHQKVGHQAHFKLQYLHKTNLSGYLFRFFTKIDQ